MAISNIRPRPDRQSKPHYRRREQKPISLSYGRAEREIVLADENDDRVMGKARPKGASHQPQSRLSAIIGHRVNNTGARIVTDGSKNRHRSISGSDAELSAEANENGLLGVLPRRTTGRRLPSGST